MKRDEMVWWTLKKVFKNLGKVERGFYRSGQPGFIRRWIMYYIIKPNVRINLAYAPNYDKQDDAEKKFLEKHGVKVYTYNWGAGGPTNLNEVNEVNKVITETLSYGKTIWIGCEGGKDRTGGVVGYWKRINGYSWESIINDFRTHKVPAEGWLELVLGTKET